LKDIYAAG